MDEAMHERASRGGEGSDHALDLRNTVLAADLGCTEDPEARRWVVLSKRHLGIELSAAPGTIGNAQVDAAGVVVLPAAGARTGDR